MPNVMKKALNSPLKDFADISEPHLLIGAKNGLTRLKRIFYWLNYLKFHSSGQGQLLSKR